MNKIAQILIFFSLAFSLMGMTQWSSKQNPQFGAKVTFSSTDVTLNDEINLVLELTFPKNYHPDLAAIKRNLSTSRAYSIFPFFIKSAKETPIQKTDEEMNQQRIEFTIEPVVTGKHSLTFLKIPFAPNDKKSASPMVGIFSEVFIISVGAPEADPSFKGAIAPLMDFSSTYPVEITPENKKKFIDNPSLIKKEEGVNKAILRSKSVPWAGMVVLFLAFLFFWASRQPFAEPKVHSQSPAKVPFSEMKALDQIKSLQKKIDGNRPIPPQEFLILPAILNDFLQEKYSLLKVFTSEEAFNNAANSLKLPEDKRNQFKQIYNLSEKIKFARYSPSADEMKQAAQFTLEIIQGRKMSNNQ